MRNTCIFSFLLHVLPAICGNLLRLRPANFTQYDIFATWAEAEAICQGSNTEMVTIYDESENDFFKRGGGWIGLYRDSISDPWKWSEGNQVEIYSNWRDHGKLHQHHYHSQYPPVRHTDAHTHNLTYSSSCGSGPCVHVNEAP